jgi:hypothetical protein
MPPGKFEIYPGKIKIRLGKEIPTDSFSTKEINQLKSVVYNTMKFL